MRNEPNRGRKVRGHTVGDIRGRYEPTNTTSGTYGRLSAEGGSFGSRTAWWSYMSSRPEERMVMRLLLQAANCISSSLQWTWLRPEVAP